MPAHTNPGRRRRGVAVCHLLSAVAATLSGTLAAFACGDELTMAEFESLHKQLQVAADAPWRTIPWKTAMLDAQQAAAREGKPIFVWAMDGHPLGCT